jgi:hypothetical protein
MQSELLSASLSKVELNKMALCAGLVSATLWRYLMQSLVAGETGAYSSPIVGLGCDVMSLAVGFCLLADNVRHCSCSSAETRATGLPPQSATQLRLKAHAN